ncbi:hypothetical protein [Psychrobacter sp. Ps1]|uniref:hypothetical protein n=1 Tax=Psychrobacter sp. Ps1 TaxID=2790955 RepID=UPI001EDCEEAC|nr:hypothetical protein [Psychrobacter sp. Ps1]
MDFLRRNHRLLNNKGDMVINNTGLAALILLVAESDPNQKKFDQIDYEYVVVRGLVTKLVIKNYTKNHVAQSAIYL